MREHGLIRRLAAYLLTVPRYSLASVVCIGAGTVILAVHRVYFAEGYAPIDFVTALRFSMMNSFITFFVAVLPSALVLHKFKKERPWQFALAPAAILALVVLAVFLVSVAGGADRPDMHGTFARLAVFKILTGAVLGLVFWATAYIRPTAWRAKV